VGSFLLPHTVYRHIANIQYRQTVTDYKLIWSAQMPAYTLHILWLNCMSVHTV